MNEYRIKKRLGSDIVGKQFDIYIKVKFLYFFHKWGSFMRASTLKDGEDAIDFLNNLEKEDRCE